jgi:hypothetical protein
MNTCQRPLKMLSLSNCHLEMTLHGSRQGILFLTDNRSGSHLCTHLEALQLEICRAGQLPVALSAGCLSQNVHHMAEADAIGWRGAVHQLAVQVACCVVHHTGSDGGDRVTHRAVDDVVCIIQLCSCAQFHKHIQPFSVCLLEFFPWPLNGLQG